MDVEGSALEMVTTAESALRDELSSVSLIAEISLGRDRMAEVVACIRAGLRFYSVERLFAKCPALCATYLAGEGLRSYGKNEKGNGYWIELAVPALRDGPRVGPLFRRALVHLELETFDQVRGHRNLVPILLHGGLPAAAAARFVEAIVNTVRTGYEEPTEIVALWRRRPSWIEMLSKPAQRLVESGGDMTVDLVDRLMRCSEQVVAGEEPSAFDLGLPEELVEAVVQGGLTTRMPRFLRHRRPEVWIDPWTDAGPEVHLPPQPAQKSGTEWIIEGGVRPRLHSPSRETTVVPMLPPARKGWRFALVVGQRESRFWELPVRAPIVFEPDGRLARDQGTVCHDALVVMPSSLAVTGPDGSPVAPTDEFPPFAVPWSEWDVRRLSVADIEYVRVTPRDPEPGANTREIILPVRSRRRARFIASLANGIVSSAGLPVSKTVPVLDVGSLREKSHWKVRVVTNDETRTVTTRELKPTVGGLSIEKFVPARRIVELDVTARGPLGSDAHFVGLVIPGLDVVLPTDPLAPTSEGVVTVSAPGLVVNGQRDSATLPVAPRQRTVHVTVGDGTRDVVLEITVPRVAWRSGEDPWGYDPIEFEIDDLSSATLSVRVGAPADVALCVIGNNGAPTQVDGPHKSGGELGAWTFRLGILADTVRVAATERCEIVLRAGSAAEVVAAIVTTRYAVSRLAILDSAVDDSAEAVVELEYDENAPFHNRELRLWSIARPWEDPRVGALPDGTASPTLVEVVAPAGKYIAELAIRDPWAVPARPRRDALGAWCGEIGDPEARRRYRNSLSIYEPAEALERVLTGPGHLRDDLATQVTNEALAVVLTEFTDMGYHALTGKVFTVAANALFTNPAAAAAAISRDRALDDPTSALRTSLLLLPDALDHPLTDDRKGDESRLWRAAPVLAAAFNPHNNQAWMDSTGWARTVPGDQAEPTDAGLPQLFPGPSEVWTSMYTARLQRVADSLAVTDGLPLTWEGHLLALLEFLRFAVTEKGRAALDRWRSHWSRLNDRRCRTDPFRESIVDKLTPQGNCPAWARFPEEAAAAALHLVAIRDERAAATGALIEATEFAPLLVERFALLAIAADRT